MSIDFNGPFIVAYTIHLFGRFGYIRVSFADGNPQKTVFQETEWAPVTPGIVFVDTAVKPDGRILSEPEFYEYLRKKGVKELSAEKDGIGWFMCEKADIIEAYNYLMNIT